MKFVEVTELPEYNRASYKHLTEELEKFMRMECRYVRVDLDEGDYSNPYSAVATFYKTIRIMALPIKVSAINGEVYLIRKDM